MKKRDEMSLRGPNVMAVLWLGLCLVCGSALSDRVEASKLTQVKPVHVPLVDLPIRSTALYDGRKNDGSGSLFLGKRRGGIVGNWFEFREESTANQPLILLHELVHAYHHKFMSGEPHEGRGDPYASGMNEGAYAKVARRRSIDQSAYAATDTLASRIFSSFVENELLRHDPGRGTVDEGHPERTEYPVEGMEGSA